MQAGQYFFEIVKGQLSDSTEFGLAIKNHWT